VKFPPIPPFMSESVYSKILTDSTIDASSKAAVISACQSCEKELGKGDATAVENCFDAFSSKNVDSGCLVPPASEDTFGHVKVFKDWLARLHTVTGDRMTLIENNMRILCGLSPGATKLQIKLARNWANRRLLGNGEERDAISLTGPVCFVFMPKEKCDVEEMFTDQCETLPCRLGLPSYLGGEAPLGFVQEYVGYVMEGEMLENLRTVTVFHPGYRSVRDLWKPGGETEPHPKGPEDHIALGGLKELVCDQVLASAAKGDIFGFEVRY
jgi:hypothetical protein